MLGLWGIVLLVLLGIVGNSSSYATSPILTSINQINCPMPSGSGIWNNTGTLMYQNGTYNYHGVSNRVLTLTCSPVHTIDGFDYYWGTANVTIAGIHIQSGIPFAGTIFYFSDYIAESMFKLGAIVTLAFNFVTPFNFTLLGYNLLTLPPLAVVFVILLYGLSYLFIGIMFYNFVVSIRGMVN